MVHVVFHGLGAQSTVHERLIAELEDVLGPQLQDGAPRRGADGRFTIGLLLVEEDLLPHGLPQEASVIEILDLVVVGVMDHNMNLWWRLEIKVTP